METSLHDISTWIAIKNASYVAAFFTTTQYLGIMPESVGVLTALILIDIVTGVAKSGILYGWQTVRSSRLASGTLAKLLLVLIPMCLALAGKGVSVDMSALAQGSITVLVLSQAYSIIGNIHAVQTKTDKNEFDAVAYILRGLRDLLERVMEKTSVKDVPL